MDFPQARPPAFRLPARGARTIGNPIKHLQTTMRTPHRPMSTIPAFMVALGLGLIGYYGVEWYQLPKYSETEIALSAEFNLQFDLQRRGPHLQPQGEDLERLRAQVHAEVVGQIEQERKKVQTRFGIGLVSLIFGIGQFVFATMLRR